MCKYQTKYLSALYVHHMYISPFTIWEAHSRAATHPHWRTRMPFSGSRESPGADPASVSPKMSWIKWPWGGKSRCACLNPNLDKQQRMDGWIRQSASVLRVSLQLTAHSRYLKESWPVNAEWKMYSTDFISSDLCLKHNIYGRLKISLKAGWLIITQHSLHYFSE